MLILNIIYLKKLMWFGYVESMNVVGLTKQVSVSEQVDKGHKGQLITTI